jgi:RNA-directed DNA polymerase
MTAGTPTGALSTETRAWHTIDWYAVHRTVRRLQAHIVKAVQAGRWGKVRALQHLLTHSFSGKALAVKRVTENEGRKTPGVDGSIWDTPAKKTCATEALRPRGYHVLPLRRLYIPKNDGTKRQRPLSIPTMLDRAMQALYLLALDPIAETLGDPNLYGFRTERSTADAIKQCFTVLARKHAPQWILEGDIRACFDGISHEWLLAHIPMDQVMLRKWVKAGFVDKHVLYPTEAGVPQGGICSPVITILTLNGLERRLRVQYPPNTRRAQRAKVNVVMYAEDVRHITWRQIPFTERRGSEDKTFGSTTYLEAKAEGDRSMSLKRRASEGVYGAALQDPRDTVRATLPKPQFPAMEAYIPCRQRLLAGSPR